MTFGLPLFRAELRAAVAEAQAAERADPHPPRGGVDPLATPRRQPIMPHAGDRAPMLEIVR